MDFFNGLANIISDKYGLGENSQNTLDIVENGTVKKYGKLGEAQKYLDKSAERKYLGEGYIRLDSFNVIPQQFEVLMQEPDATVLVKKRAFSTLSENYRSDVMDQEERLYIKASKLLFQNKCKQIAAYEKLSKVYRVSASAGQLDDQLMPLIISLVDSVSEGLPSFGISGLGNQGENSSFTKLANVIDKIRKLYAFSPVSEYTNWITDTTNIFKTDFAQGTGVIELTNITSLRTTTSVNFNNGSFSFSISDPYKITIITPYDIEKAISDASNFVANKKFFQLGKESLDTIATNNLKKLNDARRARGASEIEIITSPDTLLGKKVRAIIEGAGIEINFHYNPIPSLSSLVSDGGVKVSIESLRGGPEVGDEGLDDGKLKAIGGIKRLASVSEVSLFQDAISAVYTALEYRRSAQSTIAKQSDFTVGNDPSSKLPLDLNYVRQKLNLHYGNKPIIQEMDQVHIYISSKSKTDDKLLNGIQNMFSGMGFFQKLNNNVYDLTNQVNALFNPSQNISMQLEKSTFVGPDFPNALWSMMRNLFVNDRSGCHVFAGVVERWSDSFNNGSFTLNISGKDNSSYFSFGTTNLNPGIDTFNGPLFDPLTPFKTRNDQISTNFKDQHPEFLEENKALIQSQTSDNGLIRYKSGRHAGKPVTNDSFYQDKEISKSGLVRNVYHAPDGLVYRWKEGIGTFVYSGDSFSATNPETIGTIGITADPFAGQDIMNVLSLLITGIPYNFATYYKATRSLNGIPSPDSFFRSLTDKLQKNNMLWGSFIPFKNLIIDSDTFQQTLIAQTNVLNQNSVINDQLAKIQDLQNKAFLATAASQLTKSAELDGINASLFVEKSKLSNQIIKFQEELNKKLPLTIAGNDVSFDPDQTQSQGQKSLNSDAARAELRKKTNFLTQRLSWQVRANEDKNLLIIDDSYDKDYDLLAIENQLKGKIEQFANEYTTVAEKITNVSSLLNLEVFCDTQGHIRIRPQQYNRMPSSVFYRMLQLKQNNNIQLFPNYLETLFVDQLSALLKRVEITETKIRLDGAVLGITEDDKLAQFLTGSGVNAGSSSPFKFFSNQSGDIIDNIPQLLKSANPDNLSTLQSFGSQLKQQNSSTSTFNIADRAQIITNSSPLREITSTLTSNAINRYKTIIFQKSGQQVITDNFAIPQSTGSSVAPARSQVDTLKVSNDLAVNVAERQRLIKIVASAFKNAQEAISLDANPQRTGNKLLFPNLYGNKNIPEIFSHMIEDESFDDLGPNSGKRYVIKDHQIISLDRFGSPPPYTMIEVQGQFDPFVSSGSLPSGLSNAFPKGGNGIVAAAAVDYDLWRMYGFRSGAAVHAPFLSDPDSQCAPYAAALLSRARRDVLQATLDMAGNEYMQPGEVVYIESMNQLYYVESVSHSFTYGGRFTTNLSLKYGHNPGEYIPTHLDVIGKLLYNNRDTTSAINYRQSNIFNESQMGAIMINSQGSTILDSDITLITRGNYGEFNIKVINDILYSAAGVVAANNIKDTNIKATVELRLFHDESGNSDQLLNAATVLKNILIGRADIPLKTLTNKPNLHFSEEDVLIFDVNTSDPNERRSPSQQAMNLARSLNKNTPGFGQITSNNNPLLNVISNYIIDCIIIFENQPA